MRCVMLRIKMYAKGRDACTFAFPPLEAPIPKLNHEDR